MAATPQSAPVRRPDPGGVFASDEHRRVLGNCSAPLTLQELAYRVFIDGATLLFPGQEDDLKQVVRDLLATGDLKAEGGRYEITDLGMEHLTGPNAFNPPPMDPEAATQAIQDFIDQEHEVHDQVLANAREQVDAGELGPNVLKRAEESVAQHKEILQDLLTTAVPDEDGNYRDLEGNVTHTVADLTTEAAPATLQPAQVAPIIDDISPAPADEQTQKGGE